MGFKLNLFTRLRKFTLGARKFAQRHQFLNTYTAVYECFRKPVYDFLRPRGTVKIHAGGFDFYVLGEDYVVASDLMTYGYWEKEETEIIKSFLKPGMVFVDIGANFGYFSLLAARCVGSQGHVYAFEPEPKNYDLLCRNIQANGLLKIITPVQMAISKEAGTLELFLSSRNYGAHSLGRSNVDSALGGNVIVSTISLDAYLESCAVPRVDFIKTDTQGAEAWIFQGARKTIERNPKPTLLIEFWPLGIQGLGEDPENLLSLLSGSGYQITVLEEGRLTKVQDLKEIVKIANRHSYVTLLLEK